MSAFTFVSKLNNQPNLNLSWRKMPFAGYPMEQGTCGE